MELRKIGNTELTSPALMFGGNVFGWTLDKRESFRMLDMIFERGYRFIDTANSYGSTPGLSEQIIGEWLHKRGLRNYVTIATKAGNVKTKKSDGSYKRSRKNPPSYLEKCLIDSLGRLKTDYIDLFYTHYDDEITPIIDVLETYQKAMHSGKIRTIGASNFSENRLKEALELAQHSNYPKYQIFQTEYNLMEREAFESKFGKIAHDNGLSIATYFSLASGFLTGKYRSKEDFKGTARQRLTEKYFDSRGKSVLQALDKIAAEHKVSQAGVSLAWTLNQPFVTTCVVSATKEKHLDAFDEALHLQLSSTEMELLNRASDYK